MKRACKDCKILVDAGACPLCKNSNFGTNWNGRITVINAEKSAIAKKLTISKNGDFAIKVR
ncbi:DNA-directed RNA polymerase subunit E'' [Candidatus Woesearchaeota archaeon]|nr:DNA-directed RNA polymerase subunit E'' [Candidatus Woesearchaeota archaeon]|tara:strand:+ start:5375 stop:5557 length:183 start_codon:yes stop_codon:yes gene_type:complete